MIPTLVTIPISHYCEKARWALDRADLAYDEHAHPPFLHMVATRGSGGRSTPQLRVGRGEVITTSHGIVRWAERQNATGLFPSDPALRGRVEAFESRCDEVLGPAVRRFAYHHLLDRMDLLADMLVRGVSPAERLLFRPLSPLVPWAMRRAMRIHAATAAHDLVKIHAVFDEADALLADGRRYLFGETFSAADLAFAALGSPMVAPSDHPVRMPSLDEAPTALRDAILGFRARPSGRLIVRLYAEERRGSGDGSRHIASGR